MTTNKKVLIVGAGYLGWRLAQRLAGSHDVMAVGRSFFKSLPGGVTALSGGVGHRDFPRRLKAFAPDVVVLCWAPGVGRGDVLGYQKTYVDGLVLLRKILEDLGLTPRMIYVSSSRLVEGDGGKEVCGDGPMSRPRDEKSKVLWRAERIVMDMNRGGPPLVLRCSGLCGDGRQPGLRRLRRGGLLSGNPEGWLNLCHVDDVVSALELGLVREISGEFLLSSAPVKRGELYAEVARQAQLPVPQWESCEASLGRRLRGGAYGDVTGWMPRASLL